LEKLYFSEIFKINSFRAFQGFLDVLIGQKPCWKAAAVVIKLFWKTISKTKKGFGKLLVNGI
jgi:hypothetical protein